MQALAITKQNFEDITQKEIKEILGNNATNLKIEKSVVLFDVKEPEDLCKLAYSAQSLSKVVYLLDKNTISNVDDLKKLNIPLKELKKWINNKTFLVRCKRIGEHKFKSQDVEKEIGGLILDVCEQNKIESKVDVNEPNILFNAFIFENNIYFGIDFCGFDVGKRDYKIFSNPSSIKGTLAYYLVRLSNFSTKKGNSVLLDPFSRSGEIAIEAALFATNTSPNFFRKNKFSFLDFEIFEKIDFDDFFEEIDKKSTVQEKSKEKKFKIFAYDSIMPNVKALQKNAKIAGMIKQINMSKVDVSWLDTKFKEGEVDKVISFLPMVSRKISLKEIKKIYKELFYQLKYICNNKSECVFLCNNKEFVLEKAEEHGFKLTKEMSFNYSRTQDMLMYVLCLKKAE